MTSSCTIVRFDLVGRHWHINNITHDTKYAYFFPIFSFSIDFELGQEHRSQTRQIATPDEFSLKNNMLNWISVATTSPWHQTSFLPSDSIKHRLTHHNWGIWKAGIIHFLSAKCFFIKIHHRHFMGYFLSIHRQEVLNFGSDRLQQRSILLPPALGAI